MMNLRNNMSEFIIELNQGSKCVFERSVLVVVVLLKSFVALIVLKTEVN